MKHDLAVFKAFADETRLRIMFLLADRELCVCELVAVLDMPQGKISRHLAQLKYAELVNVRREGTWIYYSLASPASGLVERLHDYLRSDREHVAAAVGDLERLESLICDGEICAPKRKEKATAISNKLLANS